MRFWLLTWGQNWKCNVPRNLSRFYTSGSARLVWVMRYKVGKKSNKTYGVVEKQKKILQVNLFFRLINQCILFQTCSLKLIGTFNNLQSTFAKYNCTFIKFLIYVFIKSTNNLKTCTHWLMDMWLCNFWSFSMIRFGWHKKDLNQTGFLRMDFSGKPLKLAKYIHTICQSTLRLCTHSRLQNIKPGKGWCEIILSLTSQR